MLVYPSLYLKQFSRTFHCSGILQFKSQCTIQKRGAMLLKLIENKDKKKHWDMQVGSSIKAPNDNIYDKIHRPYKRASVLNSLFMKNITDVLSTGEACPEIIGYGVEVTGVRVTGDYQIVNVFWQIHDASDTCNISVEKFLAASAPAIRGELIRRNVLGKVPRIYFIRDPTNKRLADFERCLEASGVSKIEGHPTLPVQELLKNLYKFPSPQDENPDRKTIKEAKETKASVVGPVPLPERPPDMKFDVMGLDHEKILNKVIAAKRKQKQTAHTSPSLVHHAEEDGGKSKNNIYSIPESPLPSDRDEREKQFKQFYHERKCRWARMNRCYAELDSRNIISQDNADDIEIDDNFENDYLEEDQDADDGQM